jgi:hypothetical protein
MEYRPRSVGKLTGGEKPNERKKRKKNQEKKGRNIVKPFPKLLRSVRYAP